MNRREEADDIDARLAALPRPALDATAGARIHTRAREALLSSRAGRAAPGPWARLWSRLLEPAAVAIAVAVYLIWTAHALAAIDWGRLALPSTDRVGSMAGPRAAGDKQSALADDQRASGAAGGTSISGGILIGGIGGSKRASSGNG